MQVILITHIGHVFGRKLAEIFLREGHTVFAIGSNEIPGVTLLPEDLDHGRAIVENSAGKIDLFVDLSDSRSDGDCFTIRDGLKEDIVRSLFEANVLFPMAALEAFLPLLDAGEGKRLCFLTAKEASVNETRSDCGYGYKLSKAAMHNFFQMVSNKLTPSGYTMRVYDPMHLEIPAEAAAEGAYHYFTRRRGTENQNPLRDDESRLVFRDALGREHTW